MMLTEAICFKQSTQCHGGVANLVLAMAFTSDLSSISPYATQLTKHLGAKSNGKSFPLFTNQY